MITKKKKKKPDVGVCQNILSPRYWNVQVFDNYLELWNIYTSIA